MATRSTYARWITAAVLVPLCAWLVYRNLLGPEDPRLAGTPPPDDTSRRAALDLRNSAPGPSASSNRRGGPDAPLSQEELAALDPTLREDLLERSRQIAYTGSSRNIFQYYTPPPPPAPPAPPAPPPVEAPAERPAQPPPPPPIALKFYGIASPPGAGDKKAFLIDGEEIVIAKEGDTIGRFYKVIRIGVNSIELEDSRSQRRQSLELPED
jgi:hypothetical protein